MKTTLPLALAALLALPGCAQNDEPALCNLSLPGEAPGIDPLLVPVGAPAAMRVDIATRTLQCESGKTAQAPDTATAEVFDPENQLIPSEVSLQASGTVATLSFTPTVVGRHHVILAFTPVGGIRQLGVYAASHWAGAPSPVTLPLPRCGQLERTAHGLWLCDGVALRSPSDRPLRLGTGATPPDVAVSGNVVWVVGDGRVRRYVDTGSELELTGSLLLSTTTGVKVIQSRLASENELVVLDAELLHRFVFTDTGVLESPTPAFWATGQPRIPFGLDSAVGLLVRAAEDQVLVVSQPGPIDNSTACTFKVGADGAFLPEGLLCALVRGRPVGMEDGILWTQVGVNIPTLNAGRMLHRWGISEGRLEERNALILDASIAVADAPLRGGFTVPALYAVPRKNTALTRPRVLPDRSALGLELMPTNMPLAEGARATSPRFHWGGDSRPTVGFTTVYEQALP
ncbi:hypothetical protein HUA76_04785 [Myxococcus sp. CA056]|uniref:hypothetical protein n=1 Tax=unclassified Myxococcus TaxID=2648731 RepID=UPI00157A28D1|nr:MULTISPECIES: hypothetical protein [unclassified Myxococcus]NTX10089.1 hypothetical protein [Myxococcus sp. CA056]NTX39955.1 hypothetical protein [Myxococcus sp. CA033]